MAPKIFITGVTGYIAGDAFYALNKAHPEWEYAALVRTQEKANTVKKAYPSVRIVLGGLDDSDLLKDEAAKADIVLRMLPLHYNRLALLLMHSRCCGCV